MRRAISRRRNPMPSFPSSGSLLVVDVQQGFINDYTRHIPARVTRLIETGRFDELLFTAFVNTPDSPYHRLLDWHECAAPPETQLTPEMASFAARGRVFEKQGMAGLPAELEEYLCQRQPKQVYVVGIDT